jgi:hypothetical protein
LSSISSGGGNTRNTSRESDTRTRRSRPTRNPASTFRHSGLAGEARLCWFIVHEHTLCFGEMQAKIFPGCIGERRVCKCILYIFAGRWSKNHANSRFWPTPFDTARVRHIVADASSVPGELAQSLQCGSQRPWCSARSRKCVACIPGPGVR